MHLVHNVSYDRPSKQEASRAVVRIGFDQQPQTVRFLQEKCVKLRLQLRTYLRMWNIWYTAPLRRSP